MAGYDAIVVGPGAMGSAAAYHLARGGRRVLGLDARPPRHTEGSSRGESRIIRLAYYEHPDYVPLLRRAYGLWAALAAEAGEELLRPTGELIAGALACARRHDLPRDLLDAAGILLGGARLGLGMACGRVAS